MAMQNKFEAWSENAKESVSNLPNHTVWIEKIKPAFDFLVKEIWEKNWEGACHDTAAALYIVLRELKLDVKLYIGEVKLEIEKAFDHSWIEFEGFIIDAAVSLPKASGKKVGGPIFANIDLDSAKQTSLRFGVQFEGLGETASLVSMRTLSEYSNQPNCDFWGLACRIGAAVGLDLNEDDLHLEYGNIRRILKK